MKKNKVLIALLPMFCLYRNINAQNNDSIIFSHISISAGMGYFAGIWYLNTKQEPFPPPLQLNPKVNQWQNGWGAAMGIGYVFSKRANNKVSFIFTKGIIKDAFNEPVSVFFSGIQFDTYNIYELIYGHSFFVNRSGITLGIGAYVSRFKNQTPVYGAYEDANNRPFAKLYRFDDFKDIEPGTVVQVEYFYRYSQSVKFGLRAKGYFDEFHNPENFFLTPFLEVEV